MKSLIKNNQFDWEFEDIEKLWKVLDKIGKGYGLPYSQPRIEIVNTDQMLDCYVSGGLPTLYNHWSFGKQYIQMKEQYLKGNMGLAYELIIHSEPPICYCLETNSLLIQALVLAHAACGHASFDKLNYLYKEADNSDFILIYLDYIQDYVSLCEKKYGVDKVEDLLDACHALMNQSFNKSKVTKRKGETEKLKKLYKREQQKIGRFNELYSKFVEKSSELDSYFDSIYDQILHNDPDNFPQENILQFMLDYSDNLYSWQKEILNIFINLNKYRYPLYSTQIMNEGWASFWHYKIIHDMYDLGYIKEGAMLEFTKSHTSVCHEMPYSNINPYSMGFEIYKDIAHKAGDDWSKAIFFAVENFNDSTFIQQYLTPEVVEKMGLFILDWKESNPNYMEVTSTAERIEFEDLKKDLVEYLRPENKIPNIYIDEIKKVDRTLYLRYNSYHGRKLEDIHSEKTQCLKYIERLWGHPVELKEEDIGEEM